MKQSTKRNILILLIAQGITCCFCRGDVFGYWIAALLLVALIVVFTIPDDPRVNDEDFERMEYEVLDLERALRDADARADGTELLYKFYYLCWQRSYQLMHRRAQRAERKKVK